MTDKMFNFIRFWAELGISAIGILYGSLADIWNLPYGERVLQTCAAVGTFLGIFTVWQRIKFKNKEDDNDGENG